MLLTCHSDGSVRCLYTEEIDLATLGSMNGHRASHVEMGPTGEWTADMGPAGGPELGPYATRSEALAAEVAWLETYVL